MEEALLRRPQGPTAAGISALPGDGDRGDATLGEEHPGLRWEEPRQPRGHRLCL